MKSEIAFAGATREANGLWLMDTESGDHSRVYRGKHWVFGPDINTSTILPSSVVWSRVVIFNPVIRNCGTKLQDS